MIEYKKREKEITKVKYELNTGDLNGNNIILAILGNGVYVLKNNNGKRWYNLKTTMGYDKAGAYKTMQEACDFIIGLGGRILTFESNGADDCIELKDILLSHYNI